MPVSTSPGGYQAASTSAGPAAFGNVTNTLDEPIWETIKRDVIRIYRNLIMVVFPFKDRSQQSAALRNWDLWGPMVFTLGLAIMLSIGAAKPSSTFSVRRRHRRCSACCPYQNPMHAYIGFVSSDPLSTSLPSSLPLLPNPTQLVFGLISIGAIVLTVNVVLLGGTIGFFQSLCLLGYCLFPLDAAALVCLLVSSVIVKWIVVPIGIAWSSWASVPFIAGAVPTNRSALAVYPLCLLYACVGWLAIIK